MVLFVPRGFIVYFDAWFYLYLQQTDLEGETPVTTGAGTPTGGVSAPLGPKRLHVSNIPFRFREADLRNLLGVSISVSCIDKY